MFFKFPWYYVCVHTFIFFLGNETLVDVYLHEDTSSLVKPEATITLCQFTKENQMEPLVINHDAFNGELFIKDEPTENIENMDLSLSETASYESLFTPLELSTDIASQEHDYCQEEIMEELIENTISVKDNLVDQEFVLNSSEPDYFRFDHSYCIPLGDKDNINSDYTTGEIQNVKIETVQEEDNQLRFGLDESYFSEGAEKVDKKVSASL